MKRLMGLAAWCVLISSCARAQFPNPVVPGDFPDPSVIRAEEHYWATATTSGWAPIFPILLSSDLIHWKWVSAVFQQRPAWAVTNFWAPEIALYRRHYFVYYAAKKKDGPLCVAVATASRPGGPYADHGPLVCQEMGSIDPAPVTDENGQRWLIWKEDGNSRRQPTWLWAQQLSDDGTKLTGEAHRLFRNDAEWEGGVVEGPYAVRRNGWFYLFYSGGGCCGAACSYALGVARSRRLLGPWEKNPANPILRANKNWKCPGHGSIVENQAGRAFLMYHAYHREGSIWVGRQGLADEVKFHVGGWPSINGGRGPSGGAREKLLAANDDFRALYGLSPSWQWPAEQHPAVRLSRERGGWLELAGDGHADPAVVARRPTATAYEATTTIDRSALHAPMTAGLAAYGNDANIIGASAGGGKITLWQRRKGTTETLVERPAPGEGKLLYLRMRVSGGNRFAFDFSGDGKEWQALKSGVNGDYLPPWDLATRIALTCSGPAGATCRFGSFAVAQAE